MTRRLLPYEHQLISSLGITKEEYLEFVALQQEYSDPKQETVLDIRNWEAVAIVMTVVGVLLQVASMFLIPKPSSPRGANQSRDERFAPRFGFNAAQELAKYGDPIPLVYTDRTVNFNGGVRVAGSLLWSAVESYGGSQFLQMMMMLAGHPITAVDTSKFAFGQTSVSDLVFQNHWTYFKTNATGLLDFSSEIKQASSTDPTYAGGGNPYSLSVPGSSGFRVPGFSQAYSPSTSNAFGVYDPVPYNNEVQLRTAKGNRSYAGLGISLTSNLSVTDLNPGMVVGQELTIIFASTASKENLIDRQIFAQDARRGYFSSFDKAGIFKFGSAKFKVISISRGNTDEGETTIKLRCIESGYGPSISIGTAPDTNAVKEAVVPTIQNPRDALLNSEQYQADLDTVEALLNADGRGFTGVVATTTLPATQAFQVENASQLLKSGELWKKSLDGKWSRIRVLTTAEIDTLVRFVDYESQLATNIFPNAVYPGYAKLKVLAKVEIAQYTTLTASYFVNFALKNQVFTRVSGRQERYGSKGRKGYPSSDNGVTTRSSMFTVRFRRPGKAWTYVPGIFVVRRAAEHDNFNSIKFVHSATSIYQYEFEGVIDPKAEAYKNFQLKVPTTGLVEYFYIENAGSEQSVSVLGANNATVVFVGTRKMSKIDLLPPLNTTPAEMNEWDLFSLDGDTQLQQSFERGPEFSITAVSEQQTAPYNIPYYKDIALAGFNVYSGKNLQDMRSFTALVTQGKSVRLLSTTNIGAYLPSAPSNYAPDIFLDTVTDPENGIGRYASINSLDINQLAYAKRFCVANKFFMDGIIAESQNWREFWAATAPVSLLELARINGRETLIPAIPYDTNTGAIARNINVSALFNQGNIFEDSYKEEFIDFGTDLKDIIATVIYRSLDNDGVFFINKSVTVRRQDTNISDAAYQSFDISAFVTTESQAIAHGKLLCNVRRFTRSSIEFKTFPTTSPLSPGAYIYVDIGQNTWNNIYTGRITDTGTLDLPVGGSIPSGTYTIMVHKPDGTDTRSFSATLSGTSAEPSSTLVPFAGYLFVLGTENSKKRVFRVTEIEMDEEGEVTVRATNFPVDSSGLALISDFSEGSGGAFVVER